MDRILLVDDNKSLSKLLAKKMAREITDIQIDVVHNLAQAKEMIAVHKESYFLAVLDLNLPDAPNGEIVDYALEAGLSVIVLTGSIDEDTKGTFTKKDIVDYVYKGNVDDVNYIFSTINRLNKNRKYKVMVVEDSVTLRKSVKKILKSLQFEVFAAAHGEEALNYFIEHPDIKLVLTDYNMPVKNGIELLNELRQHCNKNQLGLIAMTSPTADVGTSMFLKRGANDFIAKPFTRDELICRVNNTIEAMENIEQIANYANNDFLTGAYNRRYFFDAVDTYIKMAYDHGEPFAVAMIDVDHFKAINDTYGHDGGDKVLISLAKNLKDSTKRKDIVARFGGEEFCIVLKDITKENAIKFFVNLRADIASSSVVLKNDKKVKYTISIGIAFGDDDYTLEEIIGLADKALYSAKNNGRNRVEIAQQ